jgi:hypothetical protein
VTAVTSEVDDAFRAAVAADAGLPDPEPAVIPPPPRKDVLADPDAPHGRDGKGVPLAPFGLNKKTGRPNLRRPGKPPKDDRPRVQTPADAAPGKPPVKRDYSAAIGEFTEGVWMLLSAAPVPVPAIRTRIQAQAAIVRTNTPGIVKGVNLAAQHNPQVARGVDRLTTGGASWVLPAMFALGPFVAQSVMLWRSPAEGAVEALAAQNEQAWEDTVKSMMATAQLGDAAAEAAFYDQETETPV